MSRTRVEPIDVARARDSFRSPTLDEEPMRNGPRTTVGSGTPLIPEVPLRIVSGIVFFGTTSLEAVVDWYVEAVDASVWLEQPDCTILQYDNMLFGFCERESADTDGIVTFVRDSREGVDEMYETLSNRAESEPYVNERYDIYQFFATDPEGRTVEFQAFLHETDPV